MNLAFASVRAISLLLVLCIAMVSCAIGQQLPSQSQSKAPNDVTKQEVHTHTADEPDLLRETQLGIRQKDTVGLVWWIPFEFWLQAAAKRGIPPETAAHTYVAFKDYTIIGIFLAHVSDLGSFDFVSSQDLTKRIVLLDKDQRHHLVIPEPSQDAKNLAAMMKPILTNAMGKAGENFAMLFFPARTHDGELIADANHKGAFSVLLQDQTGASLGVYEWRLPLTSLVAPKFCPVGKERVHADWDYCPWHGVPLSKGELPKGATDSR